MVSTLEIEAAQNAGREYHVAVMPEEVLRFLKVTDGVYLDLTLGSGTMTELIFRSLRTGEVIAMDCDPDAIEFCRQRFGWVSDIRVTELDSEEPVAALSGLDRYPWTGGKRLILVRGNFGELRRAPGIFPELKHGVAGVLFDLGLSQHQVHEPARGFSYCSDGPLDMRFDYLTRKMTALEVIRKSSESELGDIIRNFGEERYWRRVSHRIYAEKRRLRTTGDLAELVRQAVPVHSQRKALMRVFLGLRLVVNDELGVLQRGLEEAINLLAPGGRIVVIAYHSLEDRLVKLAFRERVQAGRLTILTAKPLRPRASEVVRNPSARSARLRAAEKRAA